MEKWIVVAVLGFLFPQMLIQAIRAEDMKTARNWGWKSGLVFAVIVALLAM